MAAAVLGEQDVETFAEVKDSVSKSQGTADGVSFCGARNYEIVDAADHAGYIQLSGRDITVESTSEDYIGVHKVQLKVSLVSQP